MDRSTKKKEERKATHLSSLIMLGSQLLGTGRFNEGLPPFITLGLDFEQIWQQLELRNTHKLSLPACTREVVQLSSGKLWRKHKNEKIQNKNSNLNKADPKEEHDDNNDLSDTESIGENDDILNSIKKRLNDDTINENNSFDEFSGSDEQDELDFDFKVDNEIVRGLSDEEDEEKHHKGIKMTKNYDAMRRKRTIVDDRFFKLADMEEFLDSEDHKEEKRLKREQKQENTYDKDYNEEESDEEIDLFEDIGSDNEDGHNAMYGDFFDPPEDEAFTKDDSSGDDLKAENKKKEVDVTEDKEESLENIADEAENESSDNDEEETGGKAKNKALKSDKRVSFTTDLLGSDEKEKVPKSSEIKSTFEKKQEQLQAKAREMEEQSLKEAPWELTGEATAAKRPENSLLDTVLDFQHTSSAAPVISDETTKTLEDYIKQRIKDKTFDDVERKEKPKEDMFEFKKRIVLDQEKSKMSLGELYEQEFLKQQQQNKEVKADPQCEKIEKDLYQLFHQLDALSNFRYTPMKPGTEVKIIVNTPAITMEEVAPVAFADSELLAPEEIHDKKKGDLMAADERSSTDKRRALRQKKKEKRERKMAKEAREKLVEKMKPGLGNKYSKAKALKQLEQINKTDKNVTLIKGDSKKLASSTAFFKQLQEEVQTNVKAKKILKEKKTKVVDASKLML